MMSPDTVFDSTVFSGSNPPSVPSHSNYKGISAVWFLFIYFRGSSSCFCYVLFLVLLSLLLSSVEFHVAFVSSLAFICIGLQSWSKGFWFNDKYSIEIRWLFCISHHYAYSICEEPGDGLEFKPLLMLSLMNYLLMSHFFARDFVIAGAVFVLVNGPWKLVHCN